MDVQKQDDQHKPTYSNYVRTQDVILKTCQRRWMIGRSGERGSGISVLAARHDDDDDDFVYKRNEEKKENRYDTLKSFISDCFQIEKKGKYDMMPEVNLFQFFKKYFLW